MPYSDFFGSGLALYAQIATLLAIAISTIAWRAVYIRIGIWKEFISLALFPLILWVILGTLDIAITTRCAYANPLCEGNMDARWFFGQFRFFGGALASIAWISLWAAIMAALMKYKNKFSNIIILTILYALAFGHLLGFSTWMTWLKPLANIRYLIQPYQPAPAIIAGAILAIFHLFKSRTINNKWQR